MKIASLYAKVGALVIVFLFIVFLATDFAVAKAQTVPTVARQAVLAAYQAQQQGRSTAPFIDAAQADPQLGMYPAYWDWRHRLADHKRPIPALALQRFIQQYRHHYVAERLKAEWAVRAAQTGDFTVALRYGLPRIQHSAARCVYYHAQLQQAQTVPLSTLMAAVHDTPMCWDMLATLKAQDKLPFAHWSQALRHAIEGHQLALANGYAKVGFSKTYYAHYQALMKDPAKWLKGQKGAPVSASHALLRAVAVARLGREDRDAGLAALLKKDILRPRDQAWAWAQLALSAALRGDNRAHQWYQSLGKQRLSDYNAAWRVRIALRHQDWPAVEKALNALSSSSQRNSTWRYWRARVLTEKGQHEEAQQQLAMLAKGTDFYAQLAQISLYGELRLPKAPPAITESRLSQVQRNAGLQRAMAMFALGWHHEAVSEWHYALRGLNEQQLHAAAHWALQEQVLDRAIQTSVRISTWVDMAQQYPMPTDSAIASQASAYGIELPLLYGLVRQESRFMQQAQSPVGALGLMQLMPTTANTLARELGWAPLSPAQIQTPAINIQLGTHYLRQMLDRFSGQTILALSAYNAGPHRAQRWQGYLERPMEAAIFIENIPFTETRNYVKKVLSAAAWYAYLQGDSHPTLLRWLSPVTPPEVLSASSLSTTP